MKKKSIRLWGLFYRVRANSKAKWDNDWTGPLGVYCFPEVLNFDKELMKSLALRPFLFRTRSQARTIAKKESEESNKTWTWVQYQVRPIKVTYEDFNRKASAECR